MKKMEQLPVKCTVGCQRHMEGLCSETNCNGFSKSIQLLLHSSKKYKEQPIHASKFPERKCCSSFYKKDTLLSPKHIPATSQETLLNNKDVFVPPKPKEFDIAAVMVTFFDAVSGMKASENIRSGRERLRVNGAIPCNNTQPTSAILMRASKVQYLSN